MHWRRWLVIGATMALTLAAGSCADGREGSRPADATSSDSSVAVANDNRTAAGTASGAMREVRLVARRTRWAPGPDSTRRLEVEAFGEEGRRPSVPAPLLRIPAGTPLRLVVRNALPDTLVVCGLAGRLCRSGDTLRIAPSASDTVDVAGDVPGTFLYWGGVVRGGKVRVRGEGGQLVGAYVVDSAARPADDRVFVITSWMGARPVAVGSDTPFVQMMNGRTWPSTERLAYAVGDTARWRIVSAGGPDHPMHLHGFYFRVDAHGDRWRDTTYGPDARRSAVTENVPSMSTMRMTWVPTRAGRWLFHCHRAAHMSVLQQWHLVGRPTPPRRDTDAGMTAGSPHLDHARDGMGGLVMGITVTGPPHAAATATGRPLRLLVQPRAGRYGSAPGLGYVLQDGTHPPAPDSIAIPGPTIVLRRDEPVAVTIVNHLPRATAVHWHGIELDSYYDGVGGWSGGADGSAATTPMIAPGDSFVARFAPPRAGTFIYHTHANEEYQLSSGLYGALVVLDASERWDPSTDHVLILGQDGPSDTAPVVLNGGAPARPIDVRAGVPHRLRLVNIIPQDMADVELRQGGRRLRWTPIAKDGATLPAVQRVEREAHVFFGPGETYDFAFVPRVGTTQIAVKSFNEFVALMHAR